MNVRIYRFFGAAFGAATFLVAVPSAVAQSPDLYEKYKFEALLFSQTQATGTTRTQAMGGACSALSADLGSFVLNPANLGTYRRSEFSFSPGLLLNTTESAAGFAGQARAEVSKDGRNNFNIANLGVAITTGINDATGNWRSGAVGINYSRLATFSNRRTYALSGLDSSRSLHEYLLQDFYLPGKGDGQILDVTDNYDNNVVNNFADLAFNTYLLDFEQNAQGQYTGRSIIPSWYRSTARQSEVTEQRGAVHQLDIGYGASYRDKLFIGGSVGILAMRYQQTRTLTESLTTPDSGPASDLSSLSLRDGYEVQGTSVNLRVGLAYHANDHIRLAAAIQTPTFANELREKGIATALTANYRRPYGPDAQTSITSSIGASEFNYSLTPPFRATGGVTFIFKTTPATASVEQAAAGRSTVGGLISADIDYVNYGSARLNAVSRDPAQADFSAANSAIRAEYASAINYRVGAELKLGEFRVRGGYGLYGTPFKDTNRGSERTVIAGGIGIRRAYGYLDIGFARTTYTADLYSPYQVTTFGKLTAPGTPGNPNANPPVPTTGPVYGYYDYGPDTAQEPVISSKVTLLNPTVTVGFTIQ